MKEILIARSKTDAKKKELCSKCNTPVDLDKPIGKLFFEKTISGEDTDIKNILYRCKGCGEIVGVLQLEK